MKLGWVIILGLACGCSKNNSNYCANAPDHNCSEMVDSAPGIDAPMGCQAQGDCTSSTASVCDLGKHQCVACDSDYANTCPVAAPICNTTAEACRACATHAECGSPGACLPDGSCGTDANVAWVMPGGNDNGACTLAAPCGSITHALLQGKLIIKVATGTITDAPMIGQDVTILADAGAKLTSPGNPAVTLTGAHTVSIHDLRIAGSSIGVYVGATDHPTLSLDHVVIDGNSNAGINMSAGTVTMSRCVVSVNSGGGAIITGTYNITNSIFVANGNGGSTTGGLTLTPMSGSVFSFNTVADNLAGGAPTVKGINCAIPSTVVTNIIVSNNPLSGCAPGYSLFDTGSPGGTNKTGAPGFLNTNPSDPTAADYYRIGAASAAIDSGDPGSTLHMDIDDHMRPDGASFDIGASEY